MASGRQALPDQGSRRCYCGRSDPHADAAHSWMVPSRAEVAEDALRAIYGRIQTFYDVDGLTKPESTVDEEIGQICLIIGEVLGDAWRTSPDPSDEVTR